MDYTNVDMSRAENGAWISKTSQASKERPSMQLSATICETEPIPLANHTPPLRPIPKCMPEPIPMPAPMPDRERLHKNEPEPDWKREAYWDKADSAQKWGHMTEHTQESVNSVSAHIHPWEWTQGHMPERNEPVFADMAAAYPSEPDGRGYCVTLGMCYVPMQKWGELYEAEYGFGRGTIFAELDLPFEGKGGKSHD